MSISAQDILKRLQLFVTQLRSLTLIKRYPTLILTRFWKQVVCPQAPSVLNLGNSLLLKNRALKINYTCILGRSEQLERCQPFCNYFGSQKSGYRS